MRTSLPKFGFLAVLALLLTVTSGVQAQTPTALPPLTGDTGSVAFWINDRGLVVGNSFDNSNNNTAVVWDEHGTPRRLRPLVGEQIAVAGSGNSINNKGEVAGFSRGGSSGLRAVVWSRNGTPRALGPGSAQAISNNGRVVGRSGSSVVVWNKNGTLVELSEPGEPVEGVSINNRGEVAGSFEATGVITPLVWDRNGTLKSLSGPGGGASSINAKSEVAGFIIVSDDNSDQRAALWDRNGTLTVLPPPSGDTRAAADGINQFGEVVGSSWTGVSVDQTAVVWDQDGNPTALPPLAGDTESWATGINKNGVVVGVSCDSSLPCNRTAVVWEWCGGDSC